MTRLAATEKRLSGKVLCVVDWTPLRLRRLHPAARRRGASWWIATTPNAVGGGTRDRIPIARANVRDGRVSVLVVWTGAAGE